MRLSTRNFGEIEVEVDKIIDFENGLPGFPDCDKFILLEEEADESGEESPFIWLQSTQDGDVCFVLINAAAVFPDYDPKVEESEMEGLGNFENDGLSIYNIAKFPDDVKEATVNLKAPIVINHGIRKGRQVICANEEYSVRQKIFNQGG